MILFQFLDVENPFFPFLYPFFFPFVFFLSQLGPQARSLADGPFFPSAGPFTFSFPLPFTRPIIGPLLFFFYFLFPSASLADGRGPPISERERVEKEKKKKGGRVGRSGPDGRRIRKSGRRWRKEM